MKLKIVDTGGKPSTLKVVNAETGEAVEGVREVVWQAGAGRCGTVQITLIGFEVEAVGAWVPISSRGVEDMRPGR